MYFIPNRGIYVGVVWVGGGAGLGVVLWSNTARFLPLYLSESLWLSHLIAPLPNALFSQPSTTRVFNYPLKPLFLSMYLSLSLSVVVQFPISSIQQVTLVWKWSMSHSECYLLLISAGSVWTQRNVMLQTMLLQYIGGSNLRLIRGYSGYAIDFFFWTPIWNIKRVKRNGRLLSLKTQSVPRSKQFSSLL
jgi:hypothetical protein